MGSKGRQMITEIVSFNIPADMSRDQVLQDAKGTVERWWKFPGLVRKVYLRDGNDKAMGIYLWESLEAAKKGHDAVWLDRAEAKWGNRPQITYYDTTMVLDNLHEEVLEYPGQSEI